MRNNEDYLDSLLNNVTKKLSEFDEDFEQKKQEADPYMTKKNLPPKTMKALETVRENQFLRDFENELQQDDADSFLAEFEAELQGEALEFERTKEAQSAESDDAYLDQIQRLVNESQAEPNADDELFASLGADDDEPEVNYSDLSAFDGLSEDTANGLTGMETLEDGPLSEQFDLPGLESAEEVFDDEEQYTSLDVSAMPQEEEAVLPEGMEALESLFDDADLLNAEEESISDSDEESIIPEDDGELSDDDIMNLLNGMSDDEALSDIGKMLEADEQSISLEDMSAEPENLTHAADVAESKQTKNVSKKKKQGFLAKLFDLLFGEDEDDDDAPDFAMGMDESDGMDNISDENLEILRAMNGDTLTEPEDSSKKKKKKKEKKKKEPKEKKEKKTKEPKEKKTKKEKKPKEKAPREKPLPRGPVIMIWLLALSMFALVFLGNNLLSRSHALLEAQRRFDQGDYVGSYEELSGVKIGESEKEFYERAKVLAGVQTELDAYYPMMEARKFDLALDCLVRALGRSDLHMAKAEEWGVTVQMNMIVTEVVKQLQDQFNVTQEQARDLYAIEDRDEYSLALDEILKGLGLK